MLHSRLKRTQSRALQSSSFNTKLIFYSSFGSLSWGIAEHIILLPVKQFKQYMRCFESCKAPTLWEVGNIQHAAAILWTMVLRQPCCCKTWSCYADTTDLFWERHCAKAVEWGRSVFAASTLWSLAHRQKQLTDLGLWNCSCVWSFVHLNLKAEQAEG